MKNIIATVFVTVCAVVLFGSVGAFETGTLSALACGGRAALAFMFGGAGVALFER